MRIAPMAVALVVAIAGPALAASTSAKMTGHDQNATGPSHSRSQSSKMHGAYRALHYTSSSPVRPVAERNKLA